MARRSGSTGDYCPATGKRKYKSRKQARHGLRRRTAEKLGVYMCPECHFYHLRNQERFSRQHSKSTSKSTPMSKRPKKKPKRRKKRRHDCAFCLDPRTGVAEFKGRRICLCCTTLLKRGASGRHKLMSALEEADRIQAAAEGDDRR